MNILAILNKNYLLKWVLVILSLLINPYTLILVLVIFTVLYLQDRVDNIDLIIIIFLGFLVFGSLERLGLMGNIRFFPILLIFFKYLLENKEKGVTDTGFLIPLIIFFLYILFDSLFFSAMLEVSLKGLLEFSFFLFFFFFSLNFKTVAQFRYIFDNLYNLFAAILLLSLISLFIPEISYARNGSGFQGITLHPNMYGLLMAAFCGLTFVQYISSKRRLDLVFTIITAGTLFMSQSRTSLLAMLLGIVFYIIINKEFRSHFSQTLLLIILPLMLLCVIFYEQILSSIISFLAKGSDDQNIFASVERSRGAIIEKQWANIYENPLWGIGFKVPSDKIHSIIEGTGEISYEKGNAFMATFEELGFFGFIFFIFILYILLFKNKFNIIFTIIPLIYLFTTFGEATLFSMGGAGFLIWTMMIINYKFQHAFKVK